MSVSPSTSKILQGATVFYLIPVAGFIGFVLILLFRQGSGQGL